MGLGQLFIGYVFLSIFTLSPTFFVTDLLGSFIIFSATEKLRRHAEKFRYAIFAVYLSFAVSTVQCIYYVLYYAGLIENIENFVNILEICRLVSMLVLTVTLLSALSELAMSVGDEKLADKGSRNMWLYIVSFILMLVLSLDFSVMKGFRESFYPFGYLFRIVCTLLNCVFMYSCYMWICLEKDHDMNTPSAVERFIGKVTMTDRKRKNAGETDKEPPPEPVKPAVTQSSGKKKKKKKR